MFRVPIKGEEMKINMICNIDGDAELNDLNAYNTVVAWFLREAFRKRDVEGCLVKGRGLLERPPPKADHTIVFSNIAMNYVRSNPAYLKMLRKTTRGTVDLWLDAAWAGWDRYFDYIFCVAKPYSSRPPQYVHGGYGADPRYLYPEQEEKAVFLDSLMWGKYKGKYDKIYKIYTEVLPTLDLKVYSPVPVYNKSPRLPWLEMQAVRRKCHFFCVTQLGGFGLGRMETATCGALVVQPKILNRPWLNVDLTMEIWDTQEDLIRILEALVDVAAIRKKALEHTWDKAAGRVLKVLSERN